MAELEFFLACEDVSVDQHTNKLSIFNVLEEGRVDEEGDGGFVRSALVSLWHFEEDEIGDDFEIQVTAEQPNGEEVDTPGIVFQPENRTHRVFTRMPGFPITGTGILEYRLFLNGELRDTYQLHVSTADQGEVAGNVEEVNED